MSNDINDIMKKLGAIEVTEETSKRDRIEYKKKSEQLLKQFGNHDSFSCNNYNNIKDILSNEEKDEFLNLFFNFSSRFYTVFGNDWEHTKMMLGCDEDIIEVQKDCTFINPGNVDIDNNWNCRGALIRGFYELNEYYEQLKNNMIKIEEKK